MAKLQDISQNVDEQVNYIKNKGRLDADRYHLRLLNIIVILLAILFRWAVAVGPYSGQNQSPMFGDYEAHRHWMEITYNLKPEAWYHNSTENDLQYWGLDYPPLTAYHSWLMGYIASKINSSWVKLHESRGLETYDSKFFMRSTVLASDIATLLPALVLYVLYFMKAPGKEITTPELLIVTLFYPGFLLIDHGHFQYNCVSSGLFLLSLMLILKRHDLLASICFVLALNHKQMELYHAVPIFAYLLGSCLKLPTLPGLLKFVGLSFAVVLSFFVLWLPFLKTFDGFTQVVSRIFPIARGIYEDKVANFWCCSSVLIKWRLWFSSPQMALISFVTTIILLAPSFFMLVLRPSSKQLKYCLVVCSLIFFLFSFQVHEKSILLVALPALLIYDENVTACSWFLMMTVLSLFPLSVKDTTELSFFALYVSYYIWLGDLNRLVDKPKEKQDINLVKLQNYLFHGSSLIGFVLSLTSCAFNPPSKYPDLFPVLNSIFCCCHFGLFLMYCLRKQYAIYAIGSKASTSDVSAVSKRKKLKKN